jgi:hypothetical protein
MQILLDQTFLRTADELVRQLGVEDYRGAKADIWLFEDAPKRLAVQDELARLGVQARVLSAYKPLLHFFLEQVDGAGLLSADIIYPRHPSCVQNRFLLEAFPLTDLFPDVAIQFIEGAEIAQRSDYRVTLHYADRVEEQEVFAPNDLKQDFLGLAVYSPTAWVCVHQEGWVADTAIAADYQLVYQAVMAAVTGYDWGKFEPYFDRLSITVSLPGIERQLAGGQELVSTTEAMHEDIYFSALEYFQRYSGRKQGSRGLQPGQIVPEIRLDNKAPAHVRVAFQAIGPTGTQAAAITRLDKKHIDAPMPVLANVHAPLPPLLIEKSLQSFTGRHFAFASRQGRAVNGVYQQGALPAVLISGAQHANETSGVVGALRAAEHLKGRSDAHFVLVPLENPDGYALHQDLCALHPAHMHHAARYTALGDDLEYRERGPWFERAARNHAFEVSGAQLHLNLHGYPAHEWTRPCSGYLPRGFELWSIPKGFFLILRYKNEQWRDVALKLLEYVTHNLSTNSRLMIYNAAQLQRYQRYASSTPFQVQHGVPYAVAHNPDQEPGVTLITEFPDETIYGDMFAFAHSVQMQTVLSACEWWWENPKAQSIAPEF